MANAGQVDGVRTSNGSNILLPALQVGAVTGTTGVIVGSAAGIIRSSPATLFAIASGIQWFGLGTTFWGTRSFVLQAWRTGDNPVSSYQDRVSASTIAGGLAGSSIGLLTRGPKNVLPGGIMFSLFGFVGQHLYNMLDRAESADIQPGKSFVERIAAKKWSPFSILTDAEYANMLKEKAFKLDVEIALLDDRIAEWKGKMAEVTTKVEETTMADPTKA